MLRVSILGPLEVSRDGVPLRVPGGKTAELLVRLAVDPGTSVRTDRLVEDLWASDAATTSRNTLQSKVARLRRALGDPPVVVSGDDGYRLDVDPAEVDASVVIEQAAIAVRFLGEGAERRAVDVCESALPLFRGEILAAAGEGSWADGPRAQLEAARLTLLETHFAARLRLGEIGVVLGQLEAAVASYPFQERLWELLITAQYRSGRQADALATYQRVRTQLADELGLDPGPRLQELERQILVHDPDLGVPYAAAGPVVGGASRGNLPSLAVDLVGRDETIVAVTDLVARHRLVELVGPGGVGKTAVALATGRRLAAADDAPSGGVWLARLETAVNADDVMDAVIAALGASSEAALIERVKAAGAVLILDNCEHVVDATASLTERLLDAAPGLRVLCTSQVPLGLDGEAVVELAPLELADAIELFARRADAQRLHRSGDAPDDALRALCESLDGLPLAIELAAARTKTLSIGEILRRLDDRFAMLSDPTSRRPERRRALRSTIRWSYDLLFPDDQRGLWALATFAGGAPLPAAEAVLSSLGVPPAAAIDILGRLAGRSLVIVDDDGGAAPVRYRLLDSIRAFAGEAAAEAGLSATARSAHARWFADAAASSTQGVRSAHQAEHLSLARTERANIDAALGWAVVDDPATALEIAAGFGWAWVVLGDSRGAQRLLAALHAVGDAASPSARADALLLAAWIEASTGRLELAREHIAAAEVLALESGEVDVQARAAYYLAYVVSHDGDFGRALELTDLADALYTGLDRPWDRAASWLFAARAAISAGDEVRSADAVEQVGHWLQSVDDPWMEVRHEAVLGELARVQHRFDDAVTHLGRAAETSGRLGFRQTEAYQVSSLGRAQCQAGDYERGAASLATAVEKAEATGDLRMAALARVHLGRALRALGQEARAYDVLAAAAAWHRGAGGGEQAELGECLLAALDAARGDPGATARLTACLETARHDGLPHVEVFALDALGRAAAEAGDVVRARALCEAADQRMVEVTHFITERDRTDAHAVRSRG